MWKSEQDPTNVTGGPGPSRTPHDDGVNHFLFSKAKPYIRTAAAGILGKADATVRQKVRRLDSPDRAFHQPAKLLTLFVGDGSVKILNLDHALANENHLGDVRNTCHPGVADQLRI